MCKLKNPFTIPNAYTRTHVGIIFVKYLTPYLNTVNAEAFYFTTPIQFLKKWFHFMWTKLINYKGNPKQSGRSMPKKEEGCLRAMKKKSNQKVRAN